MIAFLDPLSIQVKDLYRDDLTDRPKNTHNIFRRCQSAEHNTERWDWVGLISYSIAHCIVICEILTITNQANQFRQSLKVVQEMHDLFY